jgi:hypothetical protein
MILLCHSRRQYRSSYKPFIKFVEESTVRENSPGKVAGLGDCPEAHDDSNERFEKAIWDFILVVHDVVPWRIDSFREGPPAKCYETGFRQLSPVLILAGYSRKPCSSYYRLYIYSQNRTCSRKST